MLEDIKVPQGKYLLQNAANSILGKQLISAASKKGVKTINVVRRKEVIDELRLLGCAAPTLSTLLKRRLNPCPPPSLFPQRCDGYNVHQCCMAGPSM